MKHWKIQTETNITYLTLDTVKPGNRLTLDTFLELHEILAGINQENIRGLVLQSEGKNFSQGFDLEFMLNSDDGDPASLANIFSVCNQALDSLYLLPIPTLTLVKGSCIGGGLLIALATDFRAADQHAVFGFPEVKQSLVVNLGLKRVYELIGPARTKELVLLGNPISAEKLQSWGALNWLTTDGGFETTIRFFSEHVQSLPPLAFLANKKLIHQLPALSPEESQVLENKLQMEVVQSEDFREAISSFLEKRSPVFKGK